MKIATTILKVVAALAAIAGIVYVIATYGDKIVAKAKKLLHRGECDCEDCDCNEDGECCCEYDCEDCNCGDYLDDEVVEAPAEEILEADFEG